MESKSNSGVEIVTVDVHEAKALVDSGYRYLDVRTEEEFMIGRVDLEDSLNIPYMFVTPEGRVKNPNFLEQVLAAYSKDDRIVVGCQSGVRSAYATSDLVKAGLKEVYNMGGGYASWVNKGLAVKISAD
ncbi:thiosulfate sulfurtransferase 18 [Impatiens glandulifera]|uniref:thiosulfate sulfurtransferase 18 n=1 Tax=Impatiens glandulifera TaxID=253017 RepID=UPI001FB0AD74|nr:thiosulfate sulfurtransferase 18 [Impatiens glandulifera]